MKLGILTGGGDSPAINAAIRAITRESYLMGNEVLGFHNGWAGVIENDFKVLDLDSIKGILTKGGTILGTSRTNPFKLNKIDEIRNTVKSNGIDAIVSIGGDDTNGVLRGLSELDKPIPGVGIPQTIDNDIPGTDYAIGFDSSVTICTDAIDKLHTTAESHHRVMILEVMGRDAGHIALHSGIAGGAHIILVPEEEVDMEDVCDRVNKRLSKKNSYTIIVAAEGVTLKGKEQVTRIKTKDQFGHIVLGGVGDHIAGELERCIDMETRVTVIGHLQRGGIPTAYDRMMATLFGIKAARLVNEKTFGVLVCLKGSKIETVGLKEGLSGVKPIDMDLFRMYNQFQFAK
jgi:phosphofructokinase-like protein